MYEYTLINTITNEEIIDFGCSAKSVLERHPNCEIILRVYVD